MQLVTAILMVGHIGLRCDDQKESARALAGDLPISHARDMVGNNMAILFPVTL
jgi:hypothetical protein